MFNFNHVTISVNNLEESLEFYKKFVEEHHLSDFEITITKGRLGKPYFFIKDPNGILMEIIEED